MKKLSLFLFSVILLCAGCRKDKVVITETIFYGDDPEILINTSITGVVVDEDDMPLENTLITVGQKTTNTDDNGFFYLKDILANQNGATVEAEKSGFYSTSQLVFPKLNNVEFVRIKLIKSTETGLVDGSNGGTINFNGASVTFPPDAFELDGSAFGGEVSVHATFIDPLADDLFERMPGSLLGVTTQGEIMGMETFGMVGVEIFATSGDKVEIADNKLATITFPVPSEIRAEAPATIALWHFDEKSGYWMEEGKAELEGDQYVAQVAHFSFWNCDDPFPTIHLEGVVKDAAGNGFPGVQIRLKRSAPTNNTGFAITRKDGSFKGKVPKDEVLEMEVYNPCGDLVSSESIGPFSTDTKMSDLILSLPVMSNITAKVVDCDGNAVDYGYLKVITSQGNDQAFLPTDVNGNVSGTISLCTEDDFKIIGVDLADGLQSDEEVVAFNDNIDLGTIEACDNVVPTINFTVNGEDYVITNAQANTVDTVGQPIYTQLIAEDSEGSLYLSVEGEGLGTFDVQWFDFRQNGSSNSRLTEPQMQVTFTQFDAPGADSFIRGTFNGEVYDNIEQKNVSISGSFNCSRN